MTVKPRGLAFVPPFQVYIFHGWVTECILWIGSHSHHRGCSCFGWVNINGSLWEAMRTSWWIISLPYRQDKQTEISQKRLGTKLGKTPWTTRFLRASRRHESFCAVYSRVVDSEDRNVQRKYTPPCSSWSLWVQNGAGWMHWTFNQSSSFICSLLSCLFLLPLIILIHSKLPLTPLFQIPTV